jgi:OMF family outer membrane factor
VQLANNQQQLTNSLATEEVNRRKIAQRLSLPEFVTVSAADAVRPAGTWKLNLEETIVTAYKQRVELEEQLVQRDISEAGRIQALSALGPRIQLQARYNLLKIFEQPVSELSSGYSVAAVATWRLFDGGTARSQAQQQEVGKQIAETRFTQSRNNIRFQVEQSYATLISSGKNIETTTQALGQACEARRLAKLRFDAGVGTQTDVLNAETDLTRAAGSRVTAILNYNRSIAQLLRAVSNVAKGSTVSPVSTPVGNQKPDFCSTAYTEIR